MFIIDPLILARYCLAGLFGLLLFIFLWVDLVDSQKSTNEKKETNQPSQPVKASNWRAKLPNFYLIFLLIYLVVYYFVRWKFATRVITA